MPMLTKFEAAQVVADRAMLLAEGAAPRVETAETDVVRVAVAELLARRLVFEVRRGDRFLHSDELTNPPYLESVLEAWRRHI